MTGNSHGGWGCPHESKGKCAKVKEHDCDPGMKGCVLHGRFVFANSAEKNAGVEARARAAKRRKPTLRDGS